MKNNGKSSQKGALTSRTNIKTSVHSITSIKDATSSHMQSYVTIMKKPLMGAHEITGNIPSIATLDFKSIISQEVQKEVQIYTQKFDQKIIKIENENIKLKSTIQGLVAMIQDQNQIISSIHQQMTHQTSKNIDKLHNNLQSTKTTNISLMTDNIKKHGAKTERATNDTFQNVNEHPFNDTISNFDNKFQQFKQNIKEFGSPYSQKKKSKSSKRISPHINPNKQQRTLSNNDNVIFRSLQTFNGVLNNVKHDTHDSHTHNKNSPKINKKIIFNHERSQNNTSEHSYVKTTAKENENILQINNILPKKPTKSKDGGFRTSKKKDSSGNIQLNQIWKGLKKTRQKLDGVFRSQNINNIHSMTKTSLHHNKTYFTSSMNSNFINIQNSAKKLRPHEDESQEEENTFAYNFSNEVSKQNVNTSMEEAKAQSISVGYLKMEKLLRKPSSQSHFSISPSKDNGTIAALQNAKSIKNLKISNPNSLSPTTKKTNLSTIEDQGFDQQIRTFGCSLNEKLNFKNSQTSQSVNFNKDTINRLLFQMVSKDHCMCLRDMTRKSYQQNDQSDQPSNVITPSKDESQYRINDDDQEVSAPCGDYCIKIPPYKQKDIIRNIMKKQYGENMKDFVNKGCTGYPNEKKYIVDAKWWRKWCDYTGFDVEDYESQDIKIPDQPYGKINSNLTSKRTSNKNSFSLIRDNQRYSNTAKIELLDQSHNSSKIYTSNLEMLRDEIIKRKQPNKSSNNIQIHVLNQRGRSENFRSMANQYRNPGKIVNRNLISDNCSSQCTVSAEFNSVQLKRDLIEHHDYEAINHEMWKYLSSWYHYDIAIPRYLLYDARTEKTYLELYSDLKF